MIRLNRGEIVTTTKPDKPSLYPENFKRIERFKLITTAKDKGKLKGTYKVNKPLNLLNLGNKDTRSEIKHYTQLTDEDLEYFHTIDNLKIHDIIETCDRFKKYDGTILVKTLMDPNLTLNMEPPEEIVLFTERTTNAMSLINIE